MHQFTCRESFTDGFNRSRPLSLQANCFSRLMGSECLHGRSLLKFFFSAALLVLAPHLCYAQSRNASQGTITSSLCPYSCKTQGIPKKRCKDWREGERCYVEDLSRAPARIESISPVQTNGEKRAKDISTGKTVFGNGSVGKRDERCQGKAPYELAEPIIDIIRSSKSGKRSPETYQVDVSIEGVCLVDAGYYEEGRIVRKFPLETIQSFKKFFFTFTARAKNRPEIRVYNSAGERSSVPVEVFN
ncbi:MAG: hypothetical protein KDD70_16935 [Bdellovibrionales bacterium]|nr:hypothetical protein [Bdellovibrionales bacterium]